MAYIARHAVVGTKKAELGIVPGSTGTRSFIVRGKEVSCLWLTNSESIQKNMESMVD
jgi:hypothetical protein